MISSDLCTRQIFGPFLPTHLKSTCPLLQHVWLILRILLYRENPNSWRDRVAGVNPFAVAEIHVAFHVTTPMTYSGEQMRNEANVNRISWYVPDANRGDWRLAHWPASVIWGNCAWFALGPNLGCREGGEGREGRERREGREGRVKETWWWWY